MKENYTIFALKEAIQKNNITIKTEATVLFWHQLNFQLISVHHNTKKKYVLVDDEYGDAKTNAEPVLLNLLIYELQDFLEAPDYLKWSKEKGLLAERTETKAHYINLKALEPFLSELIKGLSPISPMEWELNSGEAQVLRKEFS